jgi:hypothetical protein
MNTNGQKGIGRRDFLKSASVALATAAVGPQMFAAASSKPKSIVAGFSPLGAETAATEFAFNVSSADRLSGPDGTFLRTDARIRVAGVSGGVLKNRRSREFVAHFSVGHGGTRQSAPFTAWRCGRSFDCNTPVSFNVPVNDDQKIQFSVLGEGASAPEETALPVELTLRNGGQGVPLNRGYYIIVPLFEQQVTPAWSMYMLRRNAAGRLALHEIANGEVRPVDFEHFVIRVDYARPIE